VLLDHLLQTLIEQFRTILHAPTAASHCRVSTVPAGLVPGPLVSVMGYHRQVSSVDPLSMMMCAQSSMDWRELTTSH
jgi:hypothetical protein